MRKNYDLSKLKWKPNPYVKLLKKPVTIRLEEDIIQYFKSLSDLEGVPYQALMKWFLRYCKESDLKPETQWKKTLNLPKTTRKSA